MPAWTVPLFSLLSYVIMGSTLGLLYGMFSRLTLFDRIKNPQLLLVLRLSICIAILYPIWNFIFGFLGGDIGLSPTYSQGWLVTIGVGTAITTFLLTSKTSL